METTKPGDKYPEQGATASQISWQAKWFKSLVLSQSSSLSCSGGAQILLTPVVKKVDRLKPSSNGTKLVCLEPGEARVANVASTPYLVWIS